MNSRSTKYPETFDAIRVDAIRALTTGTIHTAYPSGSRTFAII